jgi:hypothetical protein
MQSAATHSSSLSSEREGIPVFRVVIAYEDFATGKQAKKACDFLVENLSHEWQVTSQMWKFEVLSLPELRDMAAKDAAMADLIIVSSRGDAELSPDVKSWIEMWQGLAGGAVALFALFDNSLERGAHAQSTYAYLAGVAKRGRMEFFAWPEAGPGNGHRQELPGLDRRWETTGETLVPLAAVPSREASFAHWGLNE